jgi:hypothetical protein
LIGADLDESRMGYRRLPEVIAQHPGTLRSCTGCGCLAQRESDRFKD